MTVHVNVIYSLIFHIFLQSLLLEMIFEEQHDLDQAKENVNILQRGLLTPAYFFYFAPSLLTFFFPLVSLFRLFLNFHFRIFCRRVSIIGAGVICEDNMGMNSPAGILSITKHISYFKKGVELMILSALKQR